jgi:hypothetical protein
MAAHVRTVEVPNTDRRQLQLRVRSKGAPARVVECARIVLSAAEALPGKQIAAIVGCAGAMVATRRSRYAEHGLPGPEDLPRPGKRAPAARYSAGSGAGADADRATRPVRRGALVLAAAGHRARRRGRADLAGHRRPDLAPLRRAGLAGTFKFSADPALEAKIRDVVGLYLRQPDTSVVLCVDEKPQIPALERTPPTLPVRSGRAEAASLNYVPHGTTTPSAALDVATGKVTEACAKRLRHQESLVFLRRVARANLRGELRVVVHSPATRTHPDGMRLVRAISRVTLHFSPTSGSRLNQVEDFFSIITRQALPRGGFPTTANLIGAIERFIAGWNDSAGLLPDPRTWTRSSPRRPIGDAARHKRRQVRSTRSRAKAKGKYPNHPTSAACLSADWHS